jgi:transposase
VSKVSVLSGPERRRRWTPAEKRRIVEESLAPCASVIEVARQHDVHPNLLTVWRRQARTGSLGAVRAPRQESEVQFAAVSVAPEPSAWAAACAGAGGTIEIAFTSGVQLRITGAVDPTTLTAAVAALSDGRAR